jgi:2-amino-4-hydroxy-6-hydroxymethyldihydropteridine diphosphokinase
MTRAFVALGSNLDDPAAQIRAALAALAISPGISLRRASSLYRTAPVGYLDQPDFINAVAEIDSALSPTALLALLFDLEARFGRVRSFRNAPRVLDLDLLWFDGEHRSGPELILPHPRMHERAFVLIPLNEIAPGLSLGEHGAVRELAARIDAGGIERLAVD